MRLEVTKRKRKNKYKAKTIVIDDIKFDSKLESEFYILLRGKKQAGEIKGFEIQPKFELLPAFESHGKKFKPITYTADFKVINADGSIEIIDIKGMEPRDFPLRKKLFNYNNPDLLLTVLADCPIKWADHALEPGFIELDKLKKLRATEKRKNTVERGKTK